MKTRSLSPKQTARRTDPRDWRGTRTGKQRPAAPLAPVYSDPTACDGCGAVYSKRTWRRDRPVTHAMLERTVWAKCPACLLKRDESGYGRIVVRGLSDASIAAGIRRRIRNVAARAEHTGPENRIVSLEPRDGGLEILTTSQQLAHRLVHELKKSFGGRSAYRWSAPDGTLFATWHAPAGRRAV